MEHLVANLSATSSTRKEMLNNREHLVVEATLLVPGVLSGNRGPILYTHEEVGKDVSIWNGVPIVLRHPYKNGQPITARQPSVLNAVGMGTVLNARMEDGKLRADLWFDIENSKKVDAETFKRIENGQVEELSTGLFAQSKETEPSEFGGKSYSLMAINLKADHLAILPDEIGACSINDGCGVNNSTDIPEEDCNVVNASMRDGGREEDEFGFTVNAELPKGRKLNKPFRTPSSKKKFGVYTKNDKGNVVLVRFGDSNMEIKRDDPESRRNFRSRHNCNEPGPKWKARYWSCKMWSDKPVSEIVNEAEAIDQQIEFVTANSSEGSGSDITFPQEKDGDMKKSELIDQVIANGCGCYEETDREILNSFEETKLQKLIDNGKQHSALVEFKTNAEKAVDNESDDEEEDVSNGKKKGGKEKVMNNAGLGMGEQARSFDEELASLSPQLQAIINGAKEIIDERKQELVNQLLSNAEEGQRESLTPVYNAMSRDNLQILVNAIPKKKDEPEDKSPQFGFIATNNRLNGQSNRQYFEELVETH